MDNGYIVGPSWSRAAQRRDILDQNPTVLWRRSVETLKIQNDFVEAERETAPTPPPLTKTELRLPPTRSTTPLHRPHLRTAANKPAPRTTKIKLDAFDLRDGTNHRAGKGGVYAIGGDASHYIRVCHFVKCELFFVHAVRRTCGAMEQYHTGHSTTGMRLHRRDELAELTQIPRAQHAPRRRLLAGFPRSGSRSTAARTPTLTSVMGYIDPNPGETLASASHLQRKAVYDLYCAGRSQPGVSLALAVL